VGLGQAWGRKSRLQARPKPTKINDTADPICF